MLLDVPDTRIKPSLLEGYEYVPGFWDDLEIPQPTLFMPFLGPGRNGAVNDYSPHAYDGTLEGDATWSPSSDGMALRGTSTGYVQSSLVGGQDLNPRSMGVWFKAASTANQTAGLIGQVYSAGSPYTQFTLYIAGDNEGISAGNKLVFNDNTDFNAGHHREGISTTNVCDGKWHFVCVVRTSAATILYVDGIQQASNSVALADVAGTGTANLLIGALGNGGTSTTAGWFFDGWFEEAFDIHGYAMTAAQVWEVYQTPWAMFAIEDALFGVTAVAGGGFKPWFTGMQELTGIKRAA